MTPAEFVAIARSWRATPWKHQGRKKGIGVDCVGFVVEVAREAGLMDVQEAANYQRRPDGQTLRAKLNEHLIAIRQVDLRPADVVLLAFDKTDTHVGIIGDYPAAGELSLIHAYLVASRVIEHRLDGNWRKRITGCWRIPAFASPAAIVGRVIGAYFGPIGPCGRGLVGQSIGSPIDGEAV